MSMYVIRSQFRRGRRKLLGVGITLVLGLGIAAHHAEPIGTDAIHGAALCMAIVGATLAGVAAVARATGAGVLAPPRGSGELVVAPTVAPPVPVPRSRARSPDVRRE